MANSFAYAKPATVATASLLARVRGLVERVGLQEACAALGLSRGAVLAIMAQRPVRPGSLALAEQRAPR